ncbi:MAG TPA: glycosyltransferase [Chitinophaga sp.]
MSEQHTTTQIGLTVVICCYNSADRLAATLRHLAAQRHPAQFRYEVLLVDNASTDNTAAIALQIWELCAAPGGCMKIVTEPKPGQYYAREKGVNEAAYEYLVFCDDDNWLQPDYVYAAWQALRNDDRIGAVGGDNLPVTDAGAYPDWFAAYADKYALGIPAQASGYITGRGFVLGAGMATRKSLFLSMYAPGFPSLLAGRNGSNLSTGDDFEYCKRLLLAGFKLYYEQRMQLYHFIPHQRLTVAYREKLMAGILEAGKVISEYDLAIRVHNRNRTKNRWRLLLLTPFRIQLIKLNLSNRLLIDEQLTLFYLSPFDSKGHPTRTFIKRFMHYLKTLPKHYS